MNAQNKRPKAFFLNGGIGRIISAIPALEKYQEENPNEDFIVVTEGFCDILKGHPTLDTKTYDIFHKNLFHTKVINMDIVSPEPYRVSEYFNQQCNISQAFDILINNKGIRKLPKPTLILNKEELIAGRKALTDVKEKLKKEKIVVLQPFGRAITQIDSTFVDKSNRSLEFFNVKLCYFPLFLTFFYLSLIFYLNIPQSMLSSSEYFCFAFNVVRLCFQLFLHRVLL